MRCLLPMVTGIVVLAGCAAKGPVQPNGAITAAGHYRVEPQVEWNRVRLDRFEQWTVDGPQLQQLRFYRPLQDGDWLSKRQGSGERKGLRYREWMRPHDVMDRVAAALAQSGAAKVQTEGPEPLPFGDRTGFGFEFRFASREGLRYRGIARGLIDANRRLHLILYFGTRAHYFKAYRQEVQRLLKSLELFKQSRSVGRETRRQALPPRSVLPTLAKRWRIQVRRPVWESG